MRTAHNTKMARTVAVSQQDQEPIWLAQGKAALKIQRNLTDVAPDHQDVFAEIGARSARRFARICEFLEQNFPTYLSGQRNIKAGSAVMLEFMQLYDTDKGKALEIADATLEGKLSVRELRATKEKILNTRVTSRVTSRVQGSRRASAFSEMAMRRLSQPNFMPGLEPVTDKSVYDGPSPLTPDFVMYESATGKQIAVEIKVHSDTAASSVGYLAGQLISRVAVLRLRYDDAFLVMPAESENLAMETMSLWQRWIGTREAQELGLTVLLLGERSKKCISTNVPLPEAETKAASQIQE